MNIYLSGENLGHEPGVVGQAKFEYSPLVKAIKDQREEQLKAIKDQGEKQLKLLQSDANSANTKAFQSLKSLNRLN